jgi:hypothetical protein
VDAKEARFWGRMAEFRISYGDQIRVEWTVGVGIVTLSSMAFK